MLLSTPFCCLVFLTPAALILIRTPRSFYKGPSYIIVDGGSMLSKPTYEILERRLAELEEKLARYNELVAREKELQESRQWYQTLFEQANDAIFIENIDDDIIEVNVKACDLMGYTREELVEMSVADLQAPEVRGRKGEIIKGELARHGGRTFEALNLHKDGTRIPVEVSTNRIGKEDLILSIVRDIRARKAAQKELSDAYRIIEKSPATAFIWENREGWPVSFVTRNVVSIFGYSSEEFQTGEVSYAEVVHPDDLQRVADEVSHYSIKLGRNEFTHQPYRIITKAGEDRWVEDKTTVRRDGHGNIIGYQGIVEDITERRLAEAAVRESDERFRQIAENISDVFWLFDWQEQCVLYVSPAYDQIWGRSREKLYERYAEWGESIHPDDIEHATETFNRILETGGGEAREYRIVRPDGSVRWISDTGYAVKDDDGNVIRITGIAEDITARKATEDALSEEKERLAVTLHSIGDAVITTDQHSRITLMNPLAEKLTGYPQQEALGLPLTEVFHIVNEVTRQPIPNPARQVIEYGEIIGLANNTILTSREGTEYLIADSGAPIKDGGGSIIGVVLVFRDVTETRKLEREVLKVEKLESLGVLAGGIAHDFNNFLAGIIGNISLAKLDTQPGMSVYPILDEMQRAATRAKNLTQQLLTFSKGGEPVKQTSDLGELVQEAAVFALRGSNVCCDFSFQPDLFLAEVDEGQVAQVIHNLILNADQAMPSGGIISVSGVNVTLQTQNAFSLEKGDYVQITIRDSGTGIKKEYLKKIFDPYFSTKQKGSGLGLAVAYSVIDKHSGSITVESDSDVGTTFTIILPAAYEMETRRQETASEFVSGAGRRVLVMDDEDFIRKLARQMLEKLGYTVEVSVNGDDAIAKFKQALNAGDPYDAVILDLTIPGGMGGRETVEELLKLEPNLNAIVSSGYSNDPVMASCGRYGFRQAIRKPYRIQEMSAALKEVLGP